MLSEIDIKDYNAVGFAQPVNTSVADAGNLLQKACYQDAFNAGWWDSTRGSLTFSNKLMLVVSELAEAMEADRKGLKDDKLPKRDGREVELADAVIRCFDLAGAYGFSLGDAIAEKMAYNQTRKDHQKDVRASAKGKKY